MLRYIFLIIVLLFIHPVYAQLSVQQQAPATVAVKNYVNNDSNWKWGTFYYCPEDKTMFPPKRSGMGWTVNLGNPMAVVISLAILVSICYLVWYFKKRSAK